MKSELCPACGSHPIESTYQVPDHEYGVNHLAEYSRCGACGTLYQTPMPDVRTLSTFYPDHYHSFGTAGLLSRLKDKGRFHSLRSVIKSDTAVILDYGCGDGRFIKEAAKLADGLTFWGFEIAASRDKHISADGRVTIIRGSFDDLMAELPPCDVVTMNHVIEHLPNPLDVLTALHDRMKSGGVLDGQTPAADSLERRIFRTAWSGFHAPRHTVVFSRKGLNEILKRAHFTDAEVTGAFNPAGIAVSLASLFHPQTGGLIRRGGLSWLVYLGLATALYPIDLLSGSPGIINYMARKKASGGVPDMN